MPPPPPPTPTSRPRERQEPLAPLRGSIVSVITIQPCVLLAAVLIDTQSPAPMHLSFHWRWSWPAVCGNSLVLEPWFTPDCCCCCCCGAEERWGSLAQRPQLSAAATAVLTPAADRRSCCCCKLLAGDHQRCHSQAFLAQRVARMPRSFLVKKHRGGGSSSREHRRQRSKTDGKTLTSLTSLASCTWSQFELDVVGHFLHPVRKSPGEELNQSMHADTHRQFWTLKG